MDPRTTTLDEQAMLQRIADEIVGPGVIEPMEKIGWSHDAPPIEIPATDNPPQGNVANADETNKPATVDNPPTAASPSSAPTFDWEALRDPKNGLILGKYTNAFEATKGVANVVQMAKTALTRADEAERKLQQWNEVVKPREFASPPQPIVEKPIIRVTKLDEALAKIVDGGGTIDSDTVDSLKAAINEHVRETAKEVVSTIRNEETAEQTKERNEWLQVDKDMVSKYPEYLNFVDEVNLFLQTNPLYGRAVQSLITSGDKLGGAELAYVQYKLNRDATQLLNKATQMETQEIQLDAADKVRREAVDQARKDAGVMVTNAGGVHENPNVGVSQQEVADAIQEMRNTGLGEKWRALTIGKDLVGPLFD